MAECGAEGLVERGEVAVDELFGVGSGFGAVGGGGGSGVSFEGVFGFDCCFVIFYFHCSKINRCGPYRILKCLVLFLLCDRVLVKLLIQLLLGHLFPLYFLFLF